MITDVSPEANAEFQKKREKEAVDTLIQRQDALYKDALQSGDLESASSAISQMEKIFKAQLDRNFLGVDDFDGFLSPEELGFFDDIVEQGCDKTKALSMALVMQRTNAFVVEMKMRGLLSEAAPTPKELGLGS